MKKNFLFTVLIISLLLLGCGEETIKTLILLDYVEADEGTTVTINVSAGNSPYRIESADKTIATATVEGSTITVTGVKEGKTILHLTDKKKQSEDIKVTVGIAPVEFTSQYSSEAKKTLLRDFGVSLEEMSDPTSNDMDILVKREGANKLTYIKTHEWLILTSVDIKKIFNESVLAIGDEGIVLKANRDDLFRHYFIAEYNTSHYMFHISEVKKNTNPEGKTVTTIPGEYKRTR